MTGKHHELAADRLSAPSSLIWTVQPCSIDQPVDAQLGGYVCAPTVTVGCDSAESTEVTAAGPPAPAGSVVSTCDCGRGLGGYAAIRSFISLGNCVVKRPSPQPRPGSLATPG